MTASAASRVPPELLSAAPAARLAFFEQALIRHPKLLAVEEPVMALWPRPATIGITDEPPGAHWLRRLFQSVRWKGFAPAPP